MKYISIKCQYCGNNFIWSVEEQQLYHKRGLPEPKYCPICRGIIEARERDQNRSRMEKSK